jgi:hypothetical protein
MTWNHPGRSTPSTSFQIFLTSPSVTSLTSPHPALCTVPDLGRPADETHLQVDLGELGLTVFSAGFVPETTGNLEVLGRQSRGDEELFGLLRRLLEGVE